MHKIFLSIGALLGALAVALGAFGAHGLKKIVPPETVNTFQTGVQYQMYHALALIAVAIVFEKFPGRLMEWSGISFCIGVLLFSGSLYLLTMLKATGKVGLEGLGMITPFGGLFFIVGWLLFFLSVIKK
ncbi:MAG TPA: DUF423 domain-containing protein [Chitinophagaceae bacterium]|nr:DUF423 domain-containing protein [Chitinophagaceae bacterium]